MTELSKACKEREQLIAVRTQAHKDYLAQIEMNRREKTGYRKKNREAIATRLKKDFEEAGAKVIAHQLYCWI
jgi:hypothetical protein